MAAIFTIGCCDISQHSHMHHSTKYHARFFAYQSHYEQFLKLCVFLIMPNSLNIAWTYIINSTLMSSFDGPVIYYNQIIYTLAEQRDDKNVHFWQKASTFVYGGFKVC